jgi:hypothetical protein
MSFEHRSHRRSGTAFGRCFPPLRGSEARNSPDRSSAASRLSTDHCLQADPEVSSFGRRRGSAPPYGDRVLGSRDPAPTLEVALEIHDGYIRDVSAGARCPASCGASERQIGSCTSRRHEALGAQPRHPRRRRVEVGRDHQRAFRHPQSPAASFAARGRLTQCQPARRSRAFWTIMRDGLPLLEAPVSASPNDPSVPWAPGPTTPACNRCSQAGIRRLMKERGRDDRSSSAAIPIGPRLGSLRSWRSRPWGPPAAPTGPGTSAGSARDSTIWSAFAEGAAAGAGRCGFVWSGPRW